MRKHVIREKDEESERFIILPNEEFCDLFRSPVIVLSIYLSIYLSMALQPFIGIWPLFQFLELYTVGRTPWTGDQPVTMPLPTYRITQTQNKRTQTSIL
jgi:hypothetical protein